MKKIKLSLGILALAAGAIALWGTAIMAVFVAAFGQNVWMDIGGLFAGAVFIASGVLFIKARQGLRLSLEATAVGLLAVLVVVALLIRKSFVDLYLQSGVLLALFSAVLAVECGRGPVWRRS